MPLPAEVRRRIYAVSPRFAELEPFIEGDLGRAWARPGCATFGVCDDIAAGWLKWALRDAAARAGHYTGVGAKLPATGPTSRTKSTAPATKVAHDLPRPHAYAP